MNLASFSIGSTIQVQYSWLIEMPEFFGFAEIGSRRRISATSSTADRSRQGIAWDQEVWKTSKLEAVFLTNEFDDPEGGICKHVPCLRTDDLVLAGRTRNC